MRASLEPVLTVAPRPTDPHVSRYVRSYLIMRVVIGAIGVALPFMLVLVDGLWFDDDPFPRTSLSAYYYSGVRELLVGTLTGLPADVVQLTPLQDRLGAANVERIHYIAAAALIVSLAVISYFFGKREGTRAPQEGKRRSRRFWRIYHWGCAGAIGVALGWIAVTELTEWGPNESLLYGEAVSALAFGASWLWKGLELDMLRGSPAPRVDGASAASNTAATGT